MRWYLDMSIRHKLQTIVMLTSAAALLVASVAFTVYDRSTFLTAKTQDLSASAKLVGSNSTAALSFGDVNSAREALSALQANPRVIKACIYDQAGRVFASYSRDAAHIDFKPLPAYPQSTAIVNQNMVLFQPITLNGKSIGTIFIEADLTDLSARLTRFLEVDFLVLLTSLAVAFWLSTLLQRVISGPIQELANTALSVSTRDNYSIRATKKGEDEIGLLIDQFNSMLERIQRGDITTRRQDAERLVHLAHYDALTDLPNRVLLMDRLNQLTKAAQRRKSKVAVIFIDLDRFKEVNDSLGHAAGDLLLQTLAKRFSSVVRGEDTLARMGGDEFVVVIQSLHLGQDAAIIAKNLLSCVVEPVTLNGYEHTITASMGISVYPDDATDAQELIRNADAAMYQAKYAGRNAYQFYTSDLNQRALEMLSTENGLRRAVERREFVLHYQPQVDIASGSIVGAEGLIRWNHPDLGLLMPGKFISIAEERGLIVPIGSWVIEETARQAAVWRNAGIFITLGMNVSAVQFRQKDFVEELVNSVRKHGIAPNLIELELTERVIMHDAETTIKVLERLHDLGFQLSIDDFGTGYSSLNYLRRFPIDKIKIDQSFVRDKGAGNIVTAVISLARSLKLKVIAEGVETKDQLEMLREQRCDEAQGFLFSPALASGEFEKWIRQWKPTCLGSSESQVRLRG